MVKIKIKCIDDNIDIYNFIVGNIYSCEIKKDSYIINDNLACCEEEFNRRFIDIKKERVKKLNKLNNYE